MSDQDPGRNPELDQRVEQLEEDRESMDRTDRAIPLPGEDENDEGVGEVTGLVP